MMKVKFKSVEELPACLTGEDIASYLNVSRPTGYKIMNCGDFPIARIGRNVRVQKEIFLEWVKTNTNLNIT